MKRLAILTLVINNYGTKLQSYALCKAIKSMNLLEPEVINLQDSWHGKTVKISRKKQLLDVLKTYKFKAIKKIIDFVRWTYQFRIIRKNVDTFRQAESEKDDLFLKFDNNIPYSNKVYTLDDVRGGKLSGYDMFLVGSDQVWNAPRLGCLDVYMCDFLHKKEVLYLMRRASQ